MTPGKPLREVEGSSFLGVPLSHSVLSRVPLRVLDVTQRGNRTSLQKKSGAYRSSSPAWDD